MRKQILATIRKIQKLEQRRAQILGGLLVPEPLLKGGLSLVKRTCGKPNCHCATEPGHPVWVFTSGRGTQRRGQVVRQADVDQVRQRVTTYRLFRAAIRELEAITQEQKDLLKGLIESRNAPYE